MFKNLTFSGEKKKYIEIADYIRNLINRGILIEGSKLPSSREISSILSIGRNTVMSAYEILEEEGYIKTTKGKGTFVREGISNRIECSEIKNNFDFGYNNFSPKWEVNWNENINKYGLMAKRLDIVKSEYKWEKGMISFKSIAPLGNLFNIEELKRAFLNRIALEKHKIVNYGYAVGYKPLIEFLKDYMNNKGAYSEEKEILVTNGFTEGLDMLLSSFTEEGDYILCENPTHNTAMKIMKTHGLNIIGVNMTKDGMDVNDLKRKIELINGNELESSEIKKDNLKLDFYESVENFFSENYESENVDLKELKEKLLSEFDYKFESKILNLKLKRKKRIKFAYLIPSYHNPTGIVASIKKREEVYEVLKNAGIPIIEDGFNEELLYESSPTIPLASLDRESNGVIYIGSFSKILFPGLRIGWIYGDKKIIEVLESVKRCRNIHTSFLDQGILYDFMISGAFEKYIKKVRKVYKEKYKFTKKIIKKYIPQAEIWGEGGLYVFLKIKGVDTRKLLDACYKRGVLFMPGDLFYVDNFENENIEFKNKAKDTLRLGFTRLSKEEIEKGIRIIGEEVHNILS
ncbi:PLP-dependent aminotransferase family protein [Clostridium sp.]|uniref:aminotransferase-like domain-containing protein n=1 Tax=Clostridium sp. TaxID=1506 RepID=UPI002615C543|nr:PLP-dependent aminotransferase family protein [Clostridium sp.]